MVRGFRESSGRIGAVERGCDFGNPYGEWNLDVYGSGAGQRIAGVNGLCDRVNHGERGASHTDDYFNKPERSTAGNRL